MSLIDRFVTAFRDGDDGAGEAPGLIQDATGDVYVIKPSGERALVGEAAPGGSSSAISDIICLTGEITFLNLTPASDGYSFQQSDMTIAYQRGTDLSLGTGPQMQTPAAVISAAGGDFQAMTYFGTILTAGTGSSQRLMQFYSFAAFPPAGGYVNPPDLGSDKIVPLVGGIQIDDSCFSAPMFNVPAGGFAFAGPTLGGAQGATDDSVDVAITVVVWKIGPLPT